MVKVPDCIRVNSIPKELVTVFSKAKAETEIKMLLKTRERHTHRLEKFFDEGVIRLIETP
jgi:TRAP-type mannitol/chloroaromatic compound transport system substrate-binding protein